MHLHRITLASDSGLVPCITVLWGVLWAGQVEVFKIKINKLNGRRSEPRLGPSLMG